MDGRETDDDDTLERHTDTNKLTGHTASGLPHILSGRTHHSGHVLASEKNFTTNSLPQRKEFNKENSLAQHTGSTQVPKEAQPATDL